VFHTGNYTFRSGIIKNLFDRGYVREDMKKLYATDKGLFLLKQLQPTYPLPAFEKRPRAGGCPGQRANGVDLPR
jgi:hypothetical protein